MKSCMWIAVVPLRNRGKQKKNRKVHSLKWLGMFWMLLYVFFFQQFWNLKSFPQVLKGCRTYIAMSQYKPWWDFFPSPFQNLTMPLKRYRKPDLLCGPLYFVASVCRERRWCIVFMLVSAYVFLVRYFLFFSGNPFLLPEREEVRKGKFYLRSRASTLPQIWYSLLSLNQLPASKQGQLAWLWFSHALLHLWGLPCSSDSHQGH